MAELGKAPEPLQIIGNRYRVEWCIASGIEASVVGAIDCATGKRVALKCWDGPTAEQEVAALQCFVRSANVTGLFENPHVVEAYGTELGDTISYSVSEWLEGSTLARELARVGRFPARDALGHVLPCMRAVVEAHAAGVIHGDIRPAHIFLCRAKRHAPERARLFDFGRGSPGFHELRLPTRALVDDFCRYTPPELLSGGVLDARSDVYAFGLLLYEVITGERIFSADDLFDLLREIEAGPKRVIADVTQALPRGLVEVLYRAMAVKPEDRYQELASFLDELLPFASRRGSVVEPASARRQSPRETVTSNLTTDRPTLPKAPAWRDLNDARRRPRRWPGVWLSAALLSTLLAASYLALGAAPSEPQATQVTRRQAAVHAEPVMAVPLETETETTQPDVMDLDPVLVPARAGASSRRRARGSSERQRIPPPEAAPPAAADTTPAASDNVTPLERMQLQ